MAIFADLKRLVEVDAADVIFDAELLLLANSGLAYLANNAIPVGPIDNATVPEDWGELRDRDYPAVLEWLHLRVLMSFDRTLAEGGAGSVTGNVLTQHMLDLLYQLKCIYDRG